MVATRMSSRSSSGVFMEFSARRRGEIHEGSQSFLPASMDCAPRELESPFARPFRLSGHIVGEPGQTYQSGFVDIPLDTPTE